MTTPATEAIASLIELAQQGEIDPWDVQVIDIIDRFLGEIGLPHDLETAYQQANLPRSGQAFLWASMLVLLKADTLERLERGTEEELLEDLQEAVACRRALPLELERHIRRRSSAPPLRQRRVTLNELITQLQKIAAEIEEISERPVVKRVRSQSRREAMRLITELAHQENLTELASQLEDFLRFKIPLLVARQGGIDLDNLLYWWTEIKGEREKQEIKKDKVGVFWALLLLSSQSKVELYQSEFYQDLTVQLL